VTVCWVERLLALRSGRSHSGKRQTSKQTARCSAPIYQNMIHINEENVPSNSPRGCTKTEAQPRMIALVTGHSASCTTSSRAPSCFSHAPPPNATVSLRTLVWLDLVLQVAQYVTKRPFGSPPSLSALSALDPSSQEHVPEIWLAHFNNFVLGSYFSNLSGRDFEQDQAKRDSCLEVQTQSWSFASSIRRGGRSHLQDCALLLHSPRRCSGLRART
jgi:hypothetical protein